MDLTPSFHQTKTTQKKWQVFSYIDLHKKSQESYGVPVLRGESCYVVKMRRQGELVVLWAFVGVLWGRKMSEGRGREDYCAMQKLPEGVVSGVQVRPVGQLVVHPIRQYFVVLVVLTLWQVELKVPAEGQVVPAWVQLRAQTPLLPPAVRQVRPVLHVWEGVLVSQTPPKSTVPAGGVGPQMLLEAPTF